MKYLIPFLITAFAPSYLRAQMKTKFGRVDSTKLQYCLCDSLNKALIGKSKPDNNQSEFNGNGWNTQFNFQHKIGQCGYFEKSYFLYGLHFIYDENGNLIKIKKFYNGRIVGLCEVKK